MLKSKGKEDELDEFVEGIITACSWVISYRAYSCELCIYQ